ncbi:MAG TPA: hypothetical protein PKO06_02525 [Candidatus Ozemobacteraceae bacterium]|nr:hypothetical protein [Candidatus Ozemobacteraceae bacterium]
MSEIIELAQFRAFSFEEDPEALVDMQRCREHLEGSWFDREETVRMRQKIVCRALGSSWVVTLARTIVGYADLIGMPSGEGLVPHWRLHPDYRDPRLGRKLLNGLQEAAAKRSYKGLAFFCDIPEVQEDLERLGIPRSRSFFWAKASDLEGGEPLEITESREELPELMNRNYLPFLGTPLPPKLVFAQAHMASSYGVFSYQRPRLGSVLFHDRQFVLCFDGREWYIFRTEKHPEDGDAIRPLLETLGSWHDGRILLSAKALEKAGLEAMSAEPVWDCFVG